jgi:hypothetical protein
MPLQRALRLQSSSCFPLFGLVANLWLAAVLDGLRHQFWPALCPEHTAGPVSGKYT